MKKNNALFLSNEKFIDPAADEGGVKQCTREYIDLIKTGFNVTHFPVKLDKRIFARIKNRLGLFGYDHYNVTSFESALSKVINEENISVVFLNLSNTIKFSQLIKLRFPTLKIVLCSHGNESGDFLHEVALHNRLKGFKKLLGHYNLGEMLTTESVHREYIDLVLTVSEVEENIEKWLGAKHVYMVPRIIRGTDIKHEPVLGRIGFLGDLSHAPNFYGIKELCNALLKSPVKNLELRLVGAENKHVKQLQNDFPFITYMGYLDEDALIAELSTWAFALNPVFYYSRGVSTKLGKTLGMGLPVITSVIGMRGYKWGQGEILKANSAEEMALLIKNNSLNNDAIFFYTNETKTIKNTAPDLTQIMNEIYPNLIQHNTFK